LAKYTGIKSRNYLKDEQDVQISSKWGFKIPVEFSPINAIIE